MTGAVYLAANISDAFRLIFARMLTMELTAKDLKYFEHRQDKAREFVGRFPGGIDFTGKRVLDIGCGHGALTFHAAGAGAKEVVGLDVNAKLIGMADELLDERFTDLRPRVSFRHRTIEDLNEQPFDIVLSQATFEHIEDPASCLAAVNNNLSAGGRFYLGFGPLYNAPFGDHRRLNLPAQKYFPWAHVSGTHAQKISSYNRRHPGENISSLNDLGLNGLDYADYERMIDDCGLKKISYRVNTAAHPLVPVLNALRALPFLREYLSINIYAILEK